MQRTSNQLLITYTLILSFWITAAYPSQTLLNEPVDISSDFRDFSNLYYLADRLAAFDPCTATGRLIWRRAQYFTRQAFNNMLAVVRPVGPNEFPSGEYDPDPNLPFAIEFVSPRTIRIKATTGPQLGPDEPSLMLVNGRPPKDHSWRYTRIAGGHRYSSESGSITIIEQPFRILLYDNAGGLLTSTFHHADSSQTFTPILPFSFVRRASDYSRSVCAVLTLSPGEKIFGCGESFTALDKRGQRIVLWTDDSNGTQNKEMYKPIPFFLSSHGYGVFMHTSSPITCDFGHYYTSITSLMIGDDQLDLFLFIGKPKEILAAYTELTGRSPMPPLWSFGLWMSRCTYFSEDQTRQVASRLRQNLIPCDVIHLDTGWFETDWRCDYQFSRARFQDPQRMIADLKAEGFRISLWQLPYFVPKNRLFPEIIEKGLMVRDPKGNLPTEDAVLDFSNPATVGWYQDKLAGLLRMGVGAIKVDFGEAAPPNGLYASGRTGFYEHNLYPLRYNKAVAEVTKLVTGEDIIWARSAWAGSQRYPVHWGGDAESTDGGMAATLRAGLSLGLCGFSFWSHDVGGFVSRPSDDLYLRWLAFGVLTSHTRCHGTAPKEPWEYGQAVMDQFRKIVELKYRLMPYVYAQAHDCSGRGLPMLRALFVEYPDDPGSWLIDDQYLFGSDILVAPIMHEGHGSRDVYLPPGQWIDYQTGRIYKSGWHNIQAGQIPVIMLVRDGAILPHIALAQSTVQMDWSRMELVVFSTDPNLAEGLVCLPSERVLHRIRCTRKGNLFQLEQDPLAGKVAWTIRPFATSQ
ncbi:MAG: alpha-xylosidase [Sedimentisphaerales bacterium]|nr:alpha-xylosidase [Sedimentisphaerales bacterium]